MKDRIIHIVENVAIVSIIVILSVLICTGLNKYSEWNHIEKMADKGYEQVDGSWVKIR